MEYLLQVNDMNISFDIQGNKVDVIKNLSLNLKKGEILSIVGASGSGKSVFSHALMGILPQNAEFSAEILFNEQKLDKNTQVSQFALIPQTSSYLDPLMKISKQITLVDNDLSEKSKNLYPFQCSGGMIRNALFSLAHEKDASIIIADEPTPGLDLESAINALNELEKLAKMGKSVILITHDIDLAINISDRIAVFYDGTILEIANKSDFEKNTLRHPYTKALFNALPQNGFKSYDFSVKGNEKACFCSNICENFSEKCTNEQVFREFRDGMVRCNNAT
ncbi:MAG: ATP-binding cassette domain-containing protein [Clostridia bacterium]